VKEDSMRKIVLPTLACLALLFVGTAPVCGGQDFVPPPGFPGFDDGAVSDQDLPTLPINAGSDSDTGMSYRSTSTGVVQSRGSASGGGSMAASSGHTVVQKTVVLEEKLKEARRELEHPPEPADVQ
jgi:hypothetical protein